MRQDTRLTFQRLTVIRKMAKTLDRGGNFWGVEEKLGGLQFFLDGIWGALKCQKMALGGLQVSFK